MSIKEAEKALKEDLVTKLRLALKELETEPNLIPANISFINLDHVAKGYIDGNLSVDESLNLFVHVLHVVYNKFGESLIPDEVYDQLYEINKTYNLVDHIGVKVTSIKKYPHKYPHLRGTISKIHYLFKSERPKGDVRKSYEEWIANIRKQGIDLKDVRIRASLKIDGTSAILEGSEGVTQRVLKRGDTDNNEAENIPLLENRLFPDLKKYNEFGLKTELYMSFENFEKFKERYGEFNSPRSAVTSIINSDEVDDTKLPYLTVYDLELYADGETIMPENIYFDLPDATNIDALQKVVDDLQVMGIERGIPADGVVIRIMDEEIQEVLGRDGAINKFEIAYKFRATKHKTYLKKVIYSMGKQGSYTPVAKVEPLILNGNKVSSISLGSIARLQTLDLRVGQPVYITYDVIPYLYDCSPEEKETYDERVKVVTVCHECDEELEYRDSSLWCTNYDCKGNIHGRLLNWTTKVGVEGISEAIITTLIDKIGIETRAELYSIGIHADVLEKIPGYGPVSVTNIINAYREKETLPFDLIVGSLGIDNVGRTTMKKILSHFKMSDFYLMITSLNFKPITKINGIGNKIVESLFNWFKDERNMNEFNALMNRLNVLEPTRSVDSHSILFTKIRDYAFQEYLESKGYHIADKYTKSVDVVIAGEESKKTEKARKDGKAVITLQEAYDIYKYTK